MTFNPSEEIIDIPEGGEIMIVPVSLPEQNSNITVMVSEPLSEEEFVASMQRTIAESKSKEKPLRPGKKNHQGEGGGGPSKYNPAYCEQLIKFFNVPTVQERLIITTGKNDFYKEEPKLMPLKLPTFERFAHLINTDVGTMLNWCKKYKKWNQAYARAKQLQKDGLIHGALSGVYPSNFAIFVAKNFTDMEDKNKLDLGVDEGGFILEIKEARAKEQPALEAGNNPDDKTDSGVEPTSR